MLSRFFISEFGTWFNSDFVDLNDWSSMESSAICVASNVANEPLVDVSLAQLNDFIETWKQDDIDLLVAASRVDWNFSKDTEKILRKLILVIRDEIKQQLVDTI